MTLGKPYVIRSRKSLALLGLVGFWLELVRDYLRLGFKNGWFLSTPKVGLNLVGRLGFKEMQAANAGPTVSVGSLPSQAMIQDLLTIRADRFSAELALRKSSPNMSGT